MTRFYSFLGKINHLKRINRIHSYGMCVAAFLVASVYILRDYITPLVDSYDICTTSRMYDVFNWIFPKIVFHCDFITAYSRQYYPEFYVVILIDILVAIVGILFVVYFCINLKAVTVDDLKIVRQVQKNKNWRLWFGAISYFLVFAILFFFTFVHMDIIPHTTGPFGWPDMMSWPPD